MSLKKKIALSFLISSAIIALLAAFEYLSFLEIRKEIRYLEITDTISRKSLQLRRHEKNYFLYSPQKADEESAAVRSYLAELKDASVRRTGHRPGGQDVAAEQHRRIRAAVRRHRGRRKTADGPFRRTKSSYREKAKYLSLVESTFLEQPLRSADFLQKVFLLPPSHALVTGLHQLDAKIAALRKNGEDILVISKDLDKIAREKAETVIRVSQIAILIFFPAVLRRRHRHAVLYQHEHRQAAECS